jgi:hypothetical protein
VRAADPHRPFPAPGLVRRAQRCPRTDFPIHTPPVCFHRSLTRASLPRSLLRHRC